MPNQLPQPQNSLALYQIRITGWFSHRLVEYFPALVAGCEQVHEAGEQVMTLTVAVVDQAALRGILNRLWDLNLSVISLVRLDE